MAPREPTALFAAALVRAALRGHPAPVWVVTDQGRQLTSKTFRRLLRTRGIGRRYGAVGRKGSITIIERFWRSMKAERACTLVLFRPLHSIQVRLAAYAAWFNGHRPHQGLDGRTPCEVESGRVARPRSVPLRARLDVRHMDGEHDLPVLRLRRAA